MQQDAGMHRLFLLLLALCLPWAPARAAITVTDDSGRVLSLAAPAQRIVSLAPSLTETLLDLGAGARLVGADDSSAALVPGTARMGALGRWDMERLLAARPDLILVFGEAGRDAVLARLSSGRGIPVFYSNPQRLNDIPRLIEQVGALSGRQERGRLLARELAAGLARLRPPAGRAPLRVFYQLWPKPLITVNGHTFLSDAIRHCGGTNIFAGLPAPSPVVSMEAVLSADPDVILAGDDGPEPFAQWRRFPQLTAVKHQRLYRLDADRLHRPGSRILPGVAALCQTLAGTR